MKLIEKMNQWYMLKDPSFAGKSTSLGKKVLAYIVEEYYCDIKTRAHILKVKQVYDGEIHHKLTHKHDLVNDADTVLYEPVSEVLIAAYLL